MKICPACKQRNDVDADFCAFCGSALSSPQSVSPQPRPIVAAEIPLASQVMVTHLCEGTIVDGKYEIRKVIGEGGMGVVYLARDIHTQTDVVIKAIRAEYAHRKDFRDRILAEGRTLARIDHPNVVRLNAVVVEPSALYLIMQFIEGESLDHTIERHVRARTPIPLNLSLRIFSQVLEGVAAAHREGVIHRDLKPANVLVRAKDSVAKVTDFGIAKGEEDAKAGRGQTKGIIGSLLYMAPEQVRGQRDLDKRVDIYALGILLFELLCGSVPFDAPSEFEVMKMHLEAPLPRLSSVRTDLPPAIDNVLQQACAKDRAYRFSCCEDFLAAFQRCFSDAPHLPMASGPDAIPTIQQPGTTIGLVQAQTQQWTPGPQAPPTANHDDTSEVEPRGYSIVTLVTFALSLVVVLTLGGLAVAWRLGLLSPKESRRHSHATHQPSAASSNSASPEHTLSSLSKLTGTWTSDSGRVFDAVMSGNNLEFRIHDASQFPDQGYVTGEARFSLNAIDSTPNTFEVSDKIRPLPPTNTHYDLQKARSTCQEVWSEVDGEKLHAQFDGSRLTVDAAKIEPDRKVFTVQNNAVVGCTNLRKAPASRIEVVLTR